MRSGEGASTLSSLARTNPGRVSTGEASTCSPGITNGTKAVLPWPCSSAGSRASPSPPYTSFSICSIKEASFQLAYFSHGFAPMKADPRTHRTNQFDLYQGTTSVVPQPYQQKTWALAPEAGRLAGAGAKARPLLCPLRHD